MKTFYSKPLILNRLKEALNITKDTDLACLLGVSKSTLSNWVSRNSIDYDKVFSLCEHISIDWLLTGQGNMLRNTEHFETLPNNQSQNSDLVSLLKEQVKEQQAKITEQAIEIGMLRERLKLIEEERKLSEDAEAAGVAAVG